MSGYDAWLEKPYVDAARHEAEFERFCEEEKLDADDEDSWSKFEERMEDVGEES